MSRFIRLDRLTAQKRQYVHMTINLTRAQKVAERQQGDTVMLCMRAIEAHQSGIVFHQPEAEEYLAASVPPQFIDFPDD